MSFVSSIVTEPDEEDKTVDDHLDNIGFGKLNIILICFVCYMEIVVGMQITTPIFLEPYLSCHWKINAVEESLISTMFFVGMAIGGVVMGRISDRYGRKSTIILGFTCLTYFGLLSIGSPTLTWYLVIRFFIGFMTSTITTTSTFIIETTPTKYRGVATLFAIGSLSMGYFVIVTIYIIVRVYYTWRTFLLALIIPLVLILPFLYFLFESPKFLSLKQRKWQLLTVLNSIAKCNNKELKKINNIELSNATHYSLMDLIHPKYVLSFVLMNIVAMVIGFTYYSVFLLSTFISITPHQCLQNMSQTSYSYISHPLQITDDSCCKMLNWNAIITTYTSTAGEFGLLFLTVFLMKCLRRKTILILLNSVVIVSIFSLNFCLPFVVVNIVVFICRGSSDLLHIVFMIYVAEVFPTSVRNIAIGIKGFNSRIGSMLAPFVINILVGEVSFLYGTLLIVFLNVATLVIIIILPYETKYRKLPETAVDQSEYIDE